MRGRRDCLGRQNTNRGKLPEVTKFVDWMVVTNFNINMLVIHDLVVVYFGIILGETETKAYHQL